MKTTTKRTTKKQEAERSAQCCVCQNEVALAHAGLCKHCGGIYCATTDCNAVNYSPDGGLTFVPDEIGSESCVKCYLAGAGR